MAQIFCKACGAQLIPGKEFCPKCLVRPAVIVPAPVVPKQYPKDTPENRAKKLKEYKVIGVEKGLFDGAHFSKKDLETMLNSYALEGWRVIEFSINNPSMGEGPPMSQIIIVLERDLPLEP